MRLSFTSKPISSPGRTDKFPPSLVRFLRSNVGSKSKGRTTRKTPLFLRRKKNTTTSAIETQEPTSPKVTCIGQVRVRRSKKNDQNEPKKICAGNNSYSCSYCCFPKCSTICGLKIWKPHLRKWVSFFNCRSVKVRTDSSKFDSNPFDTEEVGAMEKREHRCSVSIETTSIDTTTTMTPPKNALLLTRCRSAPYRSSSLACQFWSSPLRREDEEREIEEEGAKDSVLGIELRDSTSESRKDQDSDEDEHNNNNNNNKDFGVCAKVEIQNLKNTNTILEANIENTSSTHNKKANAMDEIVDCNNDEDEGGVDKKPLMLMRCKSEPARSDTQKFDPQSSAYWRHRRLGNTESSTPHTHAVD